MVLLDGDYLYQGTFKFQEPSAILPSSLLGNLGVRQDNFKFQIAVGQGIGRYVFDLGSAPEPQDAYYNSANFKITALNEIGAFGAYQHWWSNRWRSTFVGGWVEMKDIENLPFGSIQTIHLHCGKFDF